MEQHLILTGPPEEARSAAAGAYRYLIREVALKIQHAKETDNQN
jgi:hypothetical protein